MADLLERIGRFLAELKRRQVYRVAATYAGAAFVTWQATSLLVRALDWPDWVLSAVVLVAIGAFPIVVVLAWMYEISPGGIHRPSEESGAEGSERVLLPGSRWGMQLASGLLALLAAGTLVWLLWPHQTLAFGEGDSIVLADFRNRTADSTLSGSLSTAFRISLEQSPYLNVYPERKVYETLERMGIDPDSARLTGDRAREVAEREGVPVAVVPTVSEVAGTYRVGLSIYPAGQDDAAATADVEAESRDEILDALDELAVRLRERLGESEAQIDRHRRPLAEVTTPSLTALKLYSRGQDEYTRGDFEEARRLFRHALEVDSAFTGARAQLGMMVFEQFDRKRGAELLGRAVENADGLTELESFMIRAFHASVVEGDIERAAGLYRSLLDLYPNRAEPHNNLAQILRYMGRPDEAVHHYRRALAIDSSTHLYFGGLASTYLYHLGRVDSALALSRRRVEMDSTYYWGWDHLGWAYLGADSVRAARRAYERAGKIRRDARPLLRLGYIELWADRPADAAGAFRRILKLDSVGAGDRALAHYFMGIALRRMGRDSAARQRFRRHLEVTERLARDYPRSAPVYRISGARSRSRLGETERAWETARRALAADSSSETLHFNMALVAGIQDRSGEALRHLREAIRQGYGNYVYIKVNPDVRSLRDREPFRRMVDTLLHVAGEGGDSLDADGQ